MKLCGPPADGNPEAGERWTGYDRSMGGLLLTLALLPRPVLSGAERTLDAGGASSAGPAASTFVASGAKLACLCSSDKMYGALAEETAKALRANGAQLVALAGRPGEREAALRAAGVDLFIFAGGDALAALSAAYERSG